MIEPDRMVVATSLDAHEVHRDNAIRPQRLTDYIGQRDITSQLEVFIRAANARQEALDHTLIYGPPGLGKTTLATIIAHEMNGQLVQTSGPVLDKAGDLAALLTQLQPNDVLFIDEIHRLSPSIEEILYPAMEDQKLDLMVGEGPAARSIKLDLPPFTLVGATTRAGALTSPLRDRFGIVQHLQFYPPKDLAAIVERTARILGIGLEQSAALTLAKRARGTPRIANRLLRRVRDYAQVEGQSCMDVASVERACEALRVDGAGLDPMDRRLLTLIIEQFKGGPVGIESLTAALGQERHTLEDVIEPFLIQSNFIQRTARGRVASDEAYRHLGLTPA